MKKQFQLSLILLLSILSNILYSQNFVNNKNKWHVSDCCVDFSDGQINCLTYKYEFGSPIIIEGKEYYELITNDLNPLFPIGKYYREMDGQVYSRNNENVEEVMIYDFNLVEGMEITLGNVEAVVTSVDSIMLETGEQRKQLGLSMVNATINPIYWIEGIGSEGAPFNTDYMFFEQEQDCWVSLNCYYVEEELAHQLGDCELTTGLKKKEEEGKKIVIAPNPVKDRFVLGSGINEIKSIKILDMNGRECLKEQMKGRNGIEVRGLGKGVYIVLLGLANGNIISRKIVKLDD